MKRRDVLRTVLFIILVFLMLPRDKVLAFSKADVNPKINDTTYVAPMGIRFYLPTSYEVKIGSNEWIQEPYTYKIAASSVADLDKKKNELIPKKPGKVVVSQYKKGKFNQKITVYITELVYSYINGGLSVIGTYMDNPDIKIPGTVGGIKVQKISFQAFQDWDGRSIEIPGSVKVIEEYAFYQCYNLERVKLGDGVTTINQGVFLKCKNLVEFNLPDSITDIENRVLYCCYELENLEIPASLKHIGYEAFGYTKWLTNRQEENPYVIINGILINATTAGNHAIIPDGVAVIGDGAFFEDWGLKEVEIPSSVTEIGNFAFHNCYSLTGIKIPEGVKKIGDKAFYLCEELKDIEIPKSVVYIGDRTFAASKWLEKKQKENPLVIVNKIVVDGSNTKGSVIIPEGVTQICDRAFNDNRKITKIVLPSTITDIGELAFEMTYSLKTVEVHRKGAIDIETEAFREWNGSFYGYKNSYIQTYAKENKLNFKAIK